MRTRKSWKNSRTSATTRNPCRCVPTISSRNMPKKERMTAARGVTGAAITVPGPTSVGSREASLGALRIGTCFRLVGVVPVVRAAFPNISDHVVDSKRVRKFCAHLCRADKVVVRPLYSRSFTRPIWQSVEDGYPYPGKMSRICTRRVSGMVVYSGQFTSTVEALYAAGLCKSMRSRWTCSPHNHDRQNTHPYRRERERVQ